MVPLTVVVEIFGRMSGVAGDLYSIFGAPFVEEAFKALMFMTIALLITVLVWRKPLERLGSKLAWFAGGLGIGLIFALYENLTSYSFSAWRIVPTINHAVWTGLVGVGIFLYLRLRTLPKLILPYLAAVSAHSIWNVGAELLKSGTSLYYLPLLISWVIAVAALGVVWKGSVYTRLGASTSHLRVQRARRVQGANGFGSVTKISHVFHQFDLKYCSL